MALKQSIKHPNSMQMTLREMWAVIDPDLSDPAVKRLISRQVAEKSDQRERLQEQVHVLLDGANDLTDKITRATRQAFDEAAKSLANITSSADYNQFVRDFIGPMTVDADGTVRSAESSGAGAHVAEATCTVGPARDAVKKAFFFLGGGNGVIL